MTAADEIARLATVRRDIGRLREEVRRLPVLARLTDLHAEHGALLNRPDVKQSLRDRLATALASVGKVSFHDDGGAPSSVIRAEVDLIGHYAQDEVGVRDTPGTRRVVRLIEESFPKDLVGVFELTIRSENDCGRCTSLAGFAGRAEDASRSGIFV